MFDVDASKYSCVVVCRECGWRAGTPDRRAAWLLAAEHERDTRDTHHGQLHAVHNALQATRRGPGRE